ncbi:MAG: YtxH domain-containing protein [Streptococcaceae bacterium]|jgi:gas vesicle protein|nr:YtxH domain-containing protein [Streptococcaceae bacterium]
MRIKNGFLTGAFLGGATALVSTALLSPKAKNELHKDIKYKINKLAKQHPEVTEFAKDKINNMFDCLKIIKENLNKCTDGKFDNWLKKTLNQSGFFEENTINIDGESTTSQEEDIILTMDNFAADKQKQ